MKQTIKKSLALLLALSLLCALYVPAAADEVIVTGITLDSTLLTLTLDREESATLTATVTVTPIPTSEPTESPEQKQEQEAAPAAETDTPVTITWNSSNENVEIGETSTSTDENGKVTATAQVTAKVKGRATITVEAGDQKATCNVTVNQAATGIELDSSTLTLPRQGNTATLTATVTPSDTTDKVEWESSDPNNVTVTPAQGNPAQATVRAIKAGGTATITAKAGDKKAACTVTVGDPANLVLSIDMPKADNPSTVPIGGTAELTASINPRNATNQDVTWSSNSRYITFIDPDDKNEPKTESPTLRMTAKDGKLTVRIKADRYVTNEIGVNIYVTSAEGAQASLPIKIVPPTHVTGIKLDETEISLTRGGAQVLTATISPGDAADKLVYWESSNPSVAEVKPDKDDSTKATVTATATAPDKSEAIITATTNDGSKTATCKVYVTSGTVSVTKVTIPQTLMMSMGAPQTLAATVEPAYASDKTLTWTSSDDGVVTVDGTGLVTPVSPGEATVTAKANGGSASAECKVTVSGVVLTPGKEFPLPAGGSATITMQTYGLAKNFTSWNWSSSNTNIARVVGGGSTGQVTGVAEGDVTITVTAGGYTGSCEITITDASKARNIEADSYFANGQLNFSSMMTALQNTCSSMTHNGTLDYIVNVTVPTAQGTLFDHYVAEPEPGSGISSATRYYASAGNSASSADLISNIYFVPRSGYTGPVTISYTGVSVEGNQYSGTITLSNPNTDAIQYRVFNGSPVQFRASDFTEYIQKQSARAVRYVTFELPAARYGKLQYYSIGNGLYEREVSADARFYAGISPSLDDVWFVPDSANRSNVSFTFHAYDSNGISLTDGTVTIVVTAADTATRDGTNLSYSIPAGERLYFSVDDFSAACAAAGRGQLNYIYFSSTPSSARGTLYYGSRSRVYTGSSNPFYRAASGSSSRRTVSSLYFQASGGSNATGTATFNYTGYDMDGASFTGTIRITVTSSYGTALNYSTHAGQRVWLSSADFSNASYSATGRELDYIRFDSLPSASRGTLYSLSSLVSAGGSFYRAYSGNSGNRRLIEDLSFVPAAGFTSGTVVIPFTGYSTGGKSFTGSVTIYVGAAQTAETPGNTATERDPNATPLLYYSEGEAVPLRGDDFLTDAADKLAYSLATVKFTQPSANVGRLCTNYVSPTQYNLLDTTQSFTPQMVYGIYFQPKGGFSGSAAVRFFATDITGKSYSGTLVVRVTPPQRSTWFDDMQDHVWAIPATEILAGAGVVEGTDYRVYSPAAPMTRGDFILMLSRAFSFPYYGEQSFDDVPDTMYYASAIASAMALGIATGEEAVIPPEETVIQNVFRPGDPITREEAGVFLYRSMRRAGTMPVGSWENLAIFADGDGVSDWAEEAMASLALLGVFEGDEYGRLNPQGNLTRAEMAALFYRAIT